MNYLIETKNVIKFITFILDHEYVPKDNCQGYFYLGGNSHLIRSGQLIAIVRSNFEFVSKIKNENLNISLISKNINKLTNGFVILLDVFTNEIFIFNDIFGFYPLYYSEVSGQVSYISNSFNKLSRLIASKVDDFAIIDMMLFNYPLLNRTLNQEIKRLGGGSLIHLHENKTSFQHGIFNYGERYLSPEMRYELKPDKLSDLLVHSLKSNLNRSEPTYLTMTSGFDSRTLLATVLNSAIKFKTLTFGQKGNIEMMVTERFIGKYSGFHENFYLDNRFVASLPELYRSFIAHNRDGPVVLDLIHYLALEKIIKDHNLVAGFMGGEIFVGQSIGSQVTFTEFAANLLRSVEKKELEMNFIQYYKTVPYINVDKVKSIQNEYLDSLSIYLKKKEDNHNVLRFLLNEKYAKFFGSINKLFDREINLITPFMNYDLLEYILNSNSSFLIKKQFQKSPFLNYFTKRIQAKTIIKLNSSLAETEFDRLYKVKDLVKNHLVFNVIWGYFQSHFLKRNKNPYPKPHDYDKWFRDVVLDPFNMAMKSFDLFNSSYTISKKKYEQLNSFEKKKIAIIGAIFLSYYDIN